MSTTYFLRGMGLCQGFSFNLVTRKPMGLCTKNHLGICPLHRSEESTLQFREEVKHHEDRHAFVTAQEKSTKIHH